MSDQLTQEDIDRLRAFAQQAKEAQRQALTAYWRFGIEANSFNASDADIAKEIGRGPQWVNIARKMADVYPRRKEWDDAVDENDLETVEDFKVKILGWKPKKEYSKKPPETPYFDTRGEVRVHFTGDLHSDAQNKNYDAVGAFREIVHHTFSVAKLRRLVAEAGIDPEVFQKK